MNVGTGLHPVRRHQLPVRCIAVAKLFENARASFAVECPVLRRPDARNLLLYVDLVMFPDFHLGAWRRLPGFIAMLLLVVGLGVGKQIAVANHLYGRTVVWNCS